MVVTQNSRLIDFYETFVEGQTVRLTVGGPRCVIVDVCDDCGDVTMAYGTSDGDIDVVTVPPTAIELAD